LALTSTILIFIAEKGELPMSAVEENTAIVSRFQEELFNHQGS
jgi:hypothetical protein